MEISNKEAVKLLKIATFMSVSVAILIIFIKLIAWFMTDSLSLLSSLIDSMLDVIASIVTFIAVRYSLQPADEDHRFGHGKAEDIAAFSQSVFIAGSGLFIFAEAIARFMNPQEVSNHIAGIGVMIISSLLTLMLLSYQKYVISKTNSGAIKADSLHYKTDLFVNLLVIISFVSSVLFKLQWIDPLLALIVAIHIFKSAFSVGKDAFDKLMDKEFSDDDRAKIIDCIMTSKNVKGVHDLRTRSSGIKPFIQFHLELDGNLSLINAHAISDDIEMKILKFLPNAEILVHLDVEVKKDLEPLKGRVVPLKKK
ncbi:MAG: cation diffusion facilitator family transporter [Rickettsiales bacterium]|nr:cation diffusion facilitator family transporter [Pseudomonadota bacterium]MDA0966147.1 cation diffusion facilitator family transporter [Pseudomonadota bacterium]MDG4543188.1 cation diffusion facilitator family transporter [Rickettsiales bacterium]MDG4545386.1 cation diffusion facilitator family transporter [Rickettsiales bacterium]MDG4547835.1 cation diffusion facilitator family transporter [Rickettsiales bacterium]